MSLTSRERKDLRRPEPLRDASLIVIATEGERTERDYFESPLFHSSKIKVELLPTIDGKSDPQVVLRRLREYRKKNKFPKEINDQLWLMVDVDRWGDRKLSEVVGEASKIARLAVSNPKFEIWLLLHHSEWTGSQNPKGKEVDKALKNLIGYKKNNLQWERFEGLVSVALGRAAEMDKAADARWPTEVGTHVYKLVREILRITGDGGGVCEAPPPKRRPVQRRRGIRQ